MIGIFLDSADTVEIQGYMQVGIIRGVTTNPTILSKLSGPWRERCKRIAEMIYPMPLSVEVTSNEPAKIIEQAQEFAHWVGHIVVKIPIHGIDGDAYNLGLINALEKTSNIRVNVTACMNAQQCMLAAMAGASYVSLFGGRVANMGWDPRVEIAKTRVVLDRMGSKTQLIVGSVREVVNVIDWFEAGADIVTVPPEMLEKMITHPGTKEVVQQFLTDAEKLK